MVRRGHISHIVKMHYLFKICIYISQTECIDMMCQEIISKIVDLMTPWEMNMVKIMYDFDDVY